MKIFPSIFAYLVFVVLLAIMPIAAQHNGYADWLVTNFWLIFFFLSGLTFLVLVSILVVQQKNKDYYVQGFLAATTVKILACLVFIVVFLMKNKVNKYVFLADFFYIYLLNMVFEVYVLLRNLRHKNLR
jgi:peptidoglycan/LPS O-acetylase OafA/YrhL